MTARQRQSRHLDYLAHMLEAIRQARSYIEGLAKQDFLNDKKTQDAVILKLLVLGEAAAQIATECPDFAGLHPEIPWKEMRGMRNRMAHGYFDINLDIVWDTLHGALPDLEDKIARVIASFEPCGTVGLRAIIPESARQPRSSLPPADSCSFPARPTARSRSFYLAPV